MDQMEQASARGLELHERLMAARERGDHREVADLLVAEMEACHLAWQADLLGRLLATDG